MACELVGPERNALRKLISMSEFMEGDEEEDADFVQMDADTYSASKYVRNMYTWKRTGRRDVTVVLYKVPQDARSRESMKNSIAETCKMVSANVITPLSYFSIGTRDTRLGIITEKLGNTVASKIKSGRIMVWDDKMRILRDTIAGIHAIHMRFKPHASLSWDVVFETGNGYKVFSTPGNEYGLYTVRFSTQSFERLYNTLFVDPRNHREQTPVRDTHVDIYVFGMMMYVLLLNDMELPANMNEVFGLSLRSTESGALSLSQKLLGGWRPSMRNLTEIVRKHMWIVNLIERCWAQNPEQRPTAREVMEAFRSNV